MSLQNNLGVSKTEEQSSRHLFLILHFSLYYIICTRRRAHYRAGKISLTPLTPNSSTEIVGNADDSRCFQRFVKNFLLSKLMNFNSFDE